MCGICDVLLSVVKSLRPSCVYPQRRVYEVKFSVSMKVFDDWTATATV